MRGGCIYSLPFLLDSALKKGIVRGRRGSTLSISRAPTDAAYLGKPTSHIEGRAIGLMQPLNVVIHTEGLSVQLACLYQLLPQFCVA